MARPKHRTAKPSPPARQSPASANPTVTETPKSTNSTPVSSAYPTAYPSEDEEEKRKPFKFLDLPSELRTKIYGYHFQSASQVIDLTPENFRMLSRSFGIFRVSKQLHEEAAHFFFSTHTIRLFPVYPGRFFHTKKPLLARLAPFYRSAITAFELRLGPGFTNPPRGWVVNDALGLQDATSARILKVMVEIDTSDSLFNGFRRDEEGFYENFSKDLLNKVLVATPSIVEVELDRWQSVQKDGKMIQGLIDVAQKHNKLVSWGPDSRWRDAQEESEKVAKAAKAAVIGVSPTMTDLVVALENVAVVG